MDVGRVDYVTA